MEGAETTSASDDHLNELVISIESRFEGLSLPSNRCIFTVPEMLRRTNKEAYTPVVVSIGPYHRLNPSLMPMEDHKLLYLQNLLQHNQKYCLKDYIQRVMSWEVEARNCYDRRIVLDSYQFAKMMLLDGIFMIQRFLMYWDHQWMLPNDPIFSNPQMFGAVCCDMALLENQIPFFIVQRLFKMAFKTHQQHMPELLELMRRFFENVTRKEKLPAWVIESEVKHFVHAINLLFFPPVMEASNERHEGHKEMKFPPSATELVAAGVKLRKRESECLLDIKFENGVLDIPCLILDDLVEHFFRNIIAFEQCYGKSKYLTDYLVFMEYLVSSPGDAEVLIDKGIIENWLSNKESVVQVINNFGKEIATSRNYYFYSFSDKLIKHCQKPCNKWTATFKHDYCSSPWVVISVIAAGVLLLLTVAQTVFSALSVK
ncbi:hypothetical protein BT93_L0587 [Corymbia citriodora subsp. variegata]|uniref:Uncharacterized protein n=1 Tax=Corymbia citriodora subsp. variegata TaxID=360336 RepID=A0A8T0D0P3_CORYI|nr:hypothetical protein BT93_L0587 [Corymbia citriodora subsp. variegata]